MANFLTEAIDKLTPSLLQKVEFDNFEKNKKQNITTEFGTDFDPTNDYYDDDQGFYNTLYGNSNEPCQTDQLIIRYRKASFLSYVNRAIEEICNESIIQDNEMPVKISFNKERIKKSKYNINKNIQNKISDEFYHLLNIMDFDQKGVDFFKRWYIDGRLYTQIIVEPQSLNKGIQKIKPISPLWLKKIKDPNKKSDKKIYIYSDPKDKNKKDIYQHKGIPEELIVFTPSGFYDYDTEKSLSYLHSALDEISKLDMLEDHIMIYALTRAPERRLFKVEAGQLTPKKAREKLQTFINQYKQDRVFDESTSNISAKSKRPSMIEDFFTLMRDGKGVEIDTLGGGSMLNEINDMLMYFANKAYKSLNVPVSRLDIENRTDRASIGSNVDDITKEELKFGNFISKLRKHFSYFFHELLKRQLIYKNIIKPNEWDHIRKMIFFEWKSNLEYVRARKLDNISQQTDLLRNISEFENLYFTREQIYKDILDMNDEDIEEFEAKLKDEQGKYSDGGFGGDEGSSRW